MKKKSKKESVVSCIGIKRQCSFSLMDIVQEDNHAVNKQEGRKFAYL